MAKSKTSQEKRLDTLATKTRQDKDAVLAELVRYPIVESACKRAGVGRSTYYEWRERDVGFRKLADRAIAAGEDLINDMAESMLIKNVQQGNNTAIIWWLKNHHEKYSERVLHLHEVVEPELTEEEGRAIGNALNMIGFANIISNGRIDWDYVAEKLPIAEKIVSAERAEKDREDDERHRRAGVGTPQILEQRETRREIRAAEKEKMFDAVERIMKKRRAGEKVKTDATIEPPAKKSERMIDLNKFFREHPELAARASKAAPPKPEAKDDDYEDPPVNPADIMRPLRL